MKKGDTIIVQNDLEGEVKFDVVSVRKMPISEEQQLVLRRRFTDSVVHISLSTLKKYWPDVKIEKTT